MPLRRPLECSQKTDESMLFLWTIVFMISVAALVKSSSLFVAAAESIGLRLRLPPFITGVVIVGIGTSLPELISSVVAVIMGASDIVLGNVTGSNIANIFFILGVAALFRKKMSISFDILHVDLPLLLGATALFIFITMDRVFTMFDAVLSLLGLLIFLYYMTTGIGTREGETKSSRRGSLKLDIVKLAAGGLVIYFSARYTVTSIIKLSELLNIGREAIAASAVALGTSLPELFVSIDAVRRNNLEMAIGNIIGSNIFNLVAVPGIAALFGPLGIKPIIVTFNIPVLAAATILFIIITMEKQVTRYEGLLLLLFYLFFLARVFGIA